MCGWLARGIELTGGLFPAASFTGVLTFMLKDPAWAKAIGLLGAKAQHTAGIADRPTFLGVVAQATAVGGSLLFAIVTTWVFGREFRTAR